MTTCVGSTSLKTCSCLGKQAPGNWTTTILPMLASPPSGRLPTTATWLLPYPNSTIATPIIPRHLHDPARPLQRFQTALFLLKMHSKNVFILYLIYHLWRLSLQQPPICHALCIASLLETTVVTFHGPWRTRGLSKASGLLCRLRS